MKLSVISLFPELVQGVAEHGVVGRAIKQGLLSLQVINPRDFATDRHRTVDDRPYGGGPGMLMRVEPCAQAIAQAKSAGERKVVYLSPQGRRVDQQLLKQHSDSPGLILLCGRYEGIDERLIRQQVDEEWSIGDYVLSGGELAAMVVIDSLSRLIPGVLGHEESAEQDSFMNGLLDCPHYTRPESIDGEMVPAVLLSGDHEAIRRWRLQQSLGRTWQRRPDLLAERQLSVEEQALLTEFINEQSDK